VNGPTVGRLLGSSTSPHGRDPSWRHTRILRLAKVWFQGASRGHSVSIDTVVVMKEAFRCTPTESRRCLPILRCFTVKTMLICLFSFGPFFASLGAFGLVQVAEGRNSAEAVEASSPQQSGGDSKPAAISQAEALHTEKKKKKNFPPRSAIVAAPLPIVSPAIGTGVVPVLGYIFLFNKDDKVSPPSVIGGGRLDHRRR
jgi:hypothetical protein